jgi:hypothetical protein
MIVKPEPGSGAAGVPHAGPSGVDVPSVFTHTT